MSVKLHHVPPRLASGAFILNTGITKRSLDVDGERGCGTRPPTRSRS